MATSRTRLHYFANVPEGTPSLHITQPELDSLIAQASTLRELFRLVQGTYEGQWCLTDLVHDVAGVLDDRKAVRQARDDFANRLAQEQSLNVTLRSDLTAAQFAAAEALRNLDASRKIAKDNLVRAQVAETIAESLRRDVSFYQNEFTQAANSVRHLSQKLQSNRHQLSVVRLELRRCADELSAAPRELASPREGAEREAALELQLKSLQARLDNLAVTCPPADATAEPEREAALELQLKSLQARLDNLTVTCPPADATAELERESLKTQRDLAVRRAEQEAACAANLREKLRRATVRCRDLSLRLDEARKAVSEVIDAEAAKAPKLKLTITRTR